MAEKKPWAGGLMMVKIPNEFLTILDFHCDFTAYVVYWNNTSTKSYLRAGATS
jgi:hypothetical protein